MLTLGKKTVILGKLFLESWEYGLKKEGHCSAPCPNPENSANRKFQLPYFGHIQISLHDAPTLTYFLQNANQPTHSENYQLDGSKICVSGWILIFKKL